MKLNLNAIKSKSGQEQDFVLDLEINPEIWKQKFCEPNGYGKLIGTYMFDGLNVLVKGKGEFILNCACARCGEKTLQSFVFDFNQIFYNKVSDDELDSNQYFFGEDDLDISKAVEDTVITQLPSVFLCRENCKGLCPHCYCNLNYESCDCEEKVVKSNPFANVKI